MKFENLFNFRMKNLKLTKQMRRERERERGKERGRERDKDER